MSQAKVFVVHDTGGMNFFPAKRFGNLHICLEGHINPQDYDLAVGELRERMVDAKSGDYLLPIGSPLLIAAAAVELVKRTGTLNVLTWDRLDKVYYAMEVGSL